VKIKTRIRIGVGLLIREVRDCNEKGMMLQRAIFLFFFLKLTACLEASERGRIAMGQILVRIVVSKCGFRTETWTGSAETEPGKVCAPYTWRLIRGL